MAVLEEAKSDSRPFEADRKTPAHGANFEGGFGAR
jgi:hypothetical protein